MLWSGPHFVIFLSLFLLCYATFTCPIVKDQPLYVIVDDWEGCASNGIVFSTPQRSIAMLCICYFLSPSLLACHLRCDLTILKPGSLVPKLPVVGNLGLLY